MERLTNKNLEQEMENAVIGEIPWAVSAWMRLCEIENILGDDYDLERLAELVKADREGKKARPAADVVEVVHARWENCDLVEPDCHGFGTIRIPNAGVKCTNCVHAFKKDLLWRDNYCPNCGAKMDGEREENK